jgi:hypothetical protein
VFPIICPKRWNSNQKMMWHWPYSGHPQTVFEQAELLCGDWAEGV